MQLQYLKQLHHAKGQEVKTSISKLEGNLNLVHYLPEHMERIFPFLFNLVQELHVRDWN